PPPLTTSTASPLPLHAALPILSLPLKLEGRTVTTAQLLSLAAESRELEEAVSAVGEEGVRMRLPAPPFVLLGPILLAILFGLGLDRKSTRLNSSHVAISYAVFC